MKHLFFSFALCTALVSIGAAQEFDGFSHPESVLIAKKSVFVSNIGEKLEPTSKDNDGFIAILDLESGKVEKRISNLNAPKGMNYINDTLYVADIDTIRGFSLKNFKEVFKLQVQGGIFLNAIEVFDKNTLLVSDTGTGVIYKIDIKKKKYETFVKIDSAYGGPNGLLLDEERKNLFVVGYDPMGKVKGSVIRVNVASKEVTKLSEPLGALDGVVFAKNGDLLVSDWNDNGVIHRLDSKGKITRVKLGAMGGPADMYSDGKKLYIPTMIDNKVLVIDLP